LRVGDEAEVIGMPGENECSHEMFVSIRWDRKEGLAVPLSQLKPAGDTDEGTKEAIGDWHYWVRCVRSTDPICAPPGRRGMMAE
jgi:hypothetical protein